MDMADVRDGALLCLGCATPLPTGAHACPSCLRPQDWMANTLAPYAQWSQGFLLGSAATTDQPRLITVTGLMLFALSEIVILSWVALEGVDDALAGFAHGDMAWAVLVLLLGMWAPAVLWLAATCSAVVRYLRPADAAHSKGPSPALLILALAVPAGHVVARTWGWLPGSSALHTSLFFVGFAAAGLVLGAFLARSRTERVWTSELPDLDGPGSGVTPRGGRT
ncbi:MAG: hypothetical protein AB7T63_00895 [Planctomycetota bacterium]